MAVRNIRRFRPKIWKPPAFTANYKIEVIRDLGSGSTDNLTDLHTTAFFEDRVTVGIGGFEVTIPNPNETFTGVWKIHDVIRYFKDYTAGDATTLRLRGLIEKISYSNNMITITGRTDSLRVLELTVSQSFVDQEVSTILTDLFGIYLPGFFTTGGVEVTTKTLTVTFIQKPFFEAIKELALVSGSDFYIDKDLIIQFFKQGSRLNTTDAIIHDFNLLEVGDFAEDAQFVRNRFIIYGATQEGVQVIYTVTDPDFNPAVDVLAEEIINDKSIVTNEQAVALGDFLLEEFKSPPIIGGITGILLATIQPGELLRTSSPLDNLPPDDRRIVKWRDDLTGGFLKTTVTIDKEIRKTPQIFKDRVESENKQKDVTANPNEMRFSFIDLFNDASTGTLTNLEILQGILRLVPGQISGTWESNLRVHTADILESQLIITGSKIASATYEVSNDGGATYFSIDNGARIVYATVGNLLRLRISISDQETEIDAHSVLFK